MSKKNDSNEKHPIAKSKYFKWGFTAFFVIMASVLSVNLILNIKVIANNISDLLKMLMPVIDGIVVAYLLGPLVDLFEKKIIYPYGRKRNIDFDKNKKLIRTITISLSLLLVFVLIYLFIKTVIPQVIESIQNIIIQMPEYLQSLINLANTIIKKLNLFPDQDIIGIIERYYVDIMAFVQENIIPSINGWVKSLSSSVFGFLEALWDLIIGFIIAVYLLSAKEKFRAQIKKLIYSIFKKERANLVIEDIRYIDKTFISFFAGKIIDSIIVGMLCFIVLTLFNMPYTLLISVIIGVTNIIPFFGPFIGAIPSAILILMIDPLKALYFVIIILIMQQFDGNILGPIILGNSTGLSGFWVIFSITFFGGIWGIPGVILGVPTFACIYAWIRRMMRGSLTEKNLSTDTDDYINLEFIDRNNIYHTKKTQEKYILNDKKKYTTLNIYDISEPNNEKNEPSDNAFTKAIMYINKVLKNISSKRTVEKNKNDIVINNTEEFINDNLKNDDNIDHFQ